MRPQSYTPLLRRLASDLPTQAGLRVSGKMQDLRPLVDGMRSWKFAESLTELDGEIPCAVLRRSGLRLKQQSRGVHRIVAPTRLFDWLVGYKIHRIGNAAMPGQ